MTLSSANRSGDAARYIGGLSQRIGKLKVEAPDSNFRERMVGICGIDKVRVERGFITNANYPPPPS